MKMHWDGRKCFLRFIRGTTQLDRHDAYPLCAGARTCFLDNGRTRLSLPAPHVPPASLRKSALRGDLSSGSLDRAHTLPGSLSKACPAPSPSLRIPIHYSRIFPFLQGGFANFQGALPLDPSARLSCAFFHNICACCAGISRLRARPEGFAVALWIASLPSGNYYMVMFIASISAQKVHKPNNFHYKSSNMGDDRRFPKGDRKALWSPPERRFPCNNKNPVT